MIFYVENEVDAKFDFDFEEVAKTVCDAVLRAEKCPFDVEINLLITDDEGIHEMNREFREIDRPTDVLSFPNISYEEPGVFPEEGDEQWNDCMDLDTGVIMFGDIVINEKR